MDFSATGVSRLAGLRTGPVEQFGSLTFVDIFLWSLADDQQDIGCRWGTRMVQNLATTNDVLMPEGANAIGLTADAFLLLRCPQ